MTPRNFIFRVLLGWSAVLLCLPPAQAQIQTQTTQALPAALQRAWQQTKVKLDHASILVQEVGIKQGEQQGEQRGQDKNTSPKNTRILSIHPHTPRNPASVMKLVTTWLGLSTLGADWRWRTELLMDEAATITDDGRLSGPLYIRAGGDPALTVQALWTLLRDLRLRGVRHLGEVVVDRSIFGAMTADPQAFDTAADRPYNARPDALMVNWGAVRVAFMADARARKWLPVLVPPVPGLALSGTLDWQDGPCPTYPQYTVQVNTVQAKDANPQTARDATGGPPRQLVLSGALAGACGNFSVYRLVQSQPLHFETLFRTLWQELGGTWEAGGAEAEETEAGQARDTDADTLVGMREGKVPDGAYTLVWHDSPALAEVIRSINKYSNNVMARMLLLALDVQEKQGQKTQGATEQASAALALHRLRTQSLDTEGWRITNGAGLSRSARLTAAGLARLLDTAWQSEWMPEFVSSLSIAGVDGTLQDRLRTASVRGRAHLKTGTLRDVQALAGYVQATSGRRYLVVSLVNQTQGADLSPFHDALIRWVVRQ